MRRVATIMTLALGITTLMACDSGDGDEPEEVECAFGSEFGAQFERACSENDDCVLTFHALDCCRTLMASGITVNEQDRFETAWSACDEELERCRCASGPTEVDDGSTTTEHESISVWCDGGECRSYVP